jgi:hypothetical protein
MGRLLLVLILTAGLAAAYVVSSDPAPSSTSVPASVQSTVAARAQAAAMAPAPAHALSSPRTKSSPIVTIKPTGDLSLDAIVTGAASAGEGGTITVRVSAGVDVTAVAIEVGAGAGVQVVATEGRTALDALPAGETAELTLEIVALEPGLHRLPVFVRGFTGPREVASSLVVPVRVGGGPVAGPVAKGSSVHSLQATESVR